MGTLTSAIATVALLIPAERHIDFSGWPGVAMVQFDVRLTAMDGTVYKTTIELAQGATVSQARDLLWAVWSATAGVGARWARVSSCWRVEEVCHPLGGVHVEGLET